MLFSWLKNLLSPIFNLFRDHHAVQHEANSSGTPSPDQTSGHEYASIPFYPQLIEHLEMDHQHLLQRYTEIQKQIERHEYTLIPQCLNTFKNDFKAHLDVENIKFYGYLEQRLKDQSQEFISLRRFRKEMRSIERTVIKFLDYWTEHGVEADCLEDFIAQYNEIGSALIKRIKSEEKELYTLYSQI